MPQLFSNVLLGDRFPPPFCWNNCLPLGYRSKRLPGECGQEHCEEPRPVGAERNVAIGRSRRSFLVIDDGASHRIFAARLDDDVNKLGVDHVAVDKSGDADRVMDRRGLWNPGWLVGLVAADPEFDEFGGSGAGRRAERAQFGALFK